MLLPHGTVIALVDGKNFELYLNTGMKSAPRTLGEMRRHYHKQLEVALPGEVSTDLIGEQPQVIIEALRAR